MQEADTCHAAAAQHDTAPPTAGSKRKRAEEAGEAAEEQAKNPGRGLVLLRGWLSPAGREQLTAEAAALGAAPHGGFFQVQNEKAKRMRMMHLGRSTAPPYANHPQGVPQRWQQLAHSAVTAAAAVDPSLSGLHLRPANVCVVNHYTAASKLGWHVDMLTRRDERVPVVSLSLGDSAVFRYKASYSKKAKEKAVVLRDGDALVFGGRARTIVHSVTDVDGTACGDDAQHGSCASGGGGSGGRRRRLQGRININIREL